MLGSVEILTFEVASRPCAVPLSAVMEETRAVAIAPPPDVPSIIDGVIDVRGTPTAAERESAADPQRADAARELVGLV